VVVALDNVRGEKCLVAYFVPLQVPAPKARELRTFVERLLPAHMVPEKFVVLDALPLTPNGKINRTALPDLDGAEQEDLTECRVPPRDETEKMLVAIWENNLKVHPIGVRDNFFSPGRTFNSCRANIQGDRGTIQPAAPFINAFADTDNRRNRPRSSGARSGQLVVDTRADPTAGHEASPLFDSWDWRQHSELL
jgi:hypothetical protein